MIALVIICVLLSASLACMTVAHYIQQRKIKALLKVINALEGCISLLRFWDDRSPIYVPSPYEQLQQAIESENYEEAARLRDLIRRHNANTEQEKG